jgi:site-specific recombinase XerD
VRGQFIRTSLDTRSLVSAIAKRDDLLQGKPDDPPPHDGLHVVNAPKTDITIEQAAKEFLEAKADRSRKTGKLYTAAINDYVQFAEARGLSFVRQLETLHVRRYISNCLARRGKNGKWAQNTTQGRLRHLRIWFNLCVANRWITDSPAADRDLNCRKNGKSSSRVPFTPEQITQILAAIERVPEDVRDRARALVLLLLFTGMRISHATFVEWDYLTDRDMLDYQVIKTRRPISLPPTLQKPVLDLLAKLPASRVYFFQPDRYDDYREARRALRNGEEFSMLMPDYDAKVREATYLVLRVLKLAGIDGACHRFRDTFATNMLVGGADIFTLSQMLATPMFV